MQTVAIKPKPAEWTAMVVELMALCAAMLFMPALGAPLALGIPLLGCPLVGRREEAFAWAACAVPTLSALLEGYDALYAASLALIGLLPMLVTKLLPLPRRTGAGGIALYLCAVACALAMVLAAAANALGGALWVTLPKLAVQAIGQMKNPELALHRLAGMGLLSVPEGYTGSPSGMSWMQGAYNEQMLMSLRLTLELLIEQSLPRLFVQASLIVGLFTQLRLERVEGMVLVVEAKSASEKHTRVIQPPCFRQLTLPRHLRWTAVGMLVAAMVLAASGNAVAQVAGRLAYAAFQTLYQLLGAAVVVFMLTKNDPDRQTLAGLLAGVLFVLAPHVLLLLGLAERPLHLRNPQAHKPDGT